MKTILDIFTRIHKALTTFKEILDLIIQICVVIKDHWRLFSIIGVVIFIYFGIACYAINYPKKYIRRFYQAVEDKQMDVAWNLLYPKFRDSYWNSIDDFKKGFKTTVAYTDISISCGRHILNPLDVFNALSASSLRYDVSFKVTDRFTAADLSGDQYEEDLLWLRIGHRRIYDQFKEGKIGVPTNPQPSIEMIRSYKKMIEVRKQPTWLISAIETNEVGIRPSAL